MSTGTTPMHNQLRPAIGPPRRWLFQPPCGDSDFPLARTTLTEHAVSAMSIELHTIPLYLYALWSIKADHSDDGRQARYAILGIVEQEMLHLTLAGNILRALGGSQRLYNKSFVPVYDGESHLLYDKIQLSLEPARKPLLETFIKVEAPYKAPDPKLKPASPPRTPPRTQADSEFLFAKAEPEVHADIVPEYHSIGEFYRNFEEGLKQESSKYPDILSHNADAQFDATYAFADKMVVVTDLQSALNALKTITDQGEGSIGVTDSHYRVFLDLYSHRDSWECYPVMTNPTAESFIKDDYVYRLALAFDAAYCYLLQTIDRVWETHEKTEKDKALRQHLVRNIHAIMIDVLTPIGNILMQQPVADTNYNASPCFRFYPAQQHPLNSFDLHTAIESELGRAKETPGGRSGGHKAALDAILYSVSKVFPVPVTMSPGRVGLYY